jgi:hypothetical protein
MNQPDTLTATPSINRLNTTRPAFRGARSTVTRRSAGRGGSHWSPARQLWSPPHSCALPLPTQPAKRLGDLVESVDHGNLIARVSAVAIDHDTGDVESSAVAANHLFQPCGSEYSVVVGKVSEGVSDSSGVCKVSAKLPFDDPRRRRAVPRQAGVLRHSIVDDIHIGNRMRRVGADSCLRNDFKQGLVERRMDDLRAELNDLASGHSKGANAPTTRLRASKHHNAQAGQRQGLGATESGCTSSKDRHVYRVHGRQSRDRAR